VEPPLQLPPPLLLVRTYNEICDTAQHLVSFDRSYEILCLVFKHCLTIISSLYQIAAPAAAAPAVSSGGGGGDVVSTLRSLQGPGQVWGADGIAVGKEESDLKGYENFGKFVSLLESTGVAAELAGAGPFTIFAPTDPALESYELLRGPVDARVLKMHIVPGLISSKDVSSADLTSLGGEKLTYRYAVRKNFVNDAIIGEKTFGPYSDYPIDVACSNGVIHAVGLCFAM
jgi:hypothetical protein